MRQVFLLALLVVFIPISACSHHKGVYSRGYYSGRPAKWPKEIHIVKAGETLYSIAWQYGHDYREVASWNGIDRSYTIFPEQELKVMKPAGYAEPKKTDLTKIHKPTPPRSLPVKATPVRSTVKKPFKTRTTSQNLRWRWPARGKILSRFSSRDPGQKGIDIAGQTGQAIYAAEQGHVVYSGSGLRGYGELIIVKHNETFLSAYAHNHRLLVKEGQKVKKGEHIADMGKTGTERVMLHFEIRRDGIPVNPFEYLPKQ
ncbi:MAG: peptidoglycan DD-metalloendopeptidase family protein [Cyclobacteriaceae bacterium]|nr:peptidoglycan DD-metalloendopeptidase family protein [Cyclobacteriaceae bacterium]